MWYFEYSYVIPLQGIQLLFYLLKILQSVYKFYLSEFQ